MQNDIFRRLGQLMAASIVQGGSSLHIFNQSVFKYVCGDDLATITPKISEIPDKDVRDILEQVHSSYSNNKILVIDYYYHGIT